MSDEEKSTGDQGMSAAAAVPAEQPYPDDRTTLADASPAAGPPGKWQMPKPKFQQTSGYLPQGYLKVIKEAAGAARSADGSEDTTREQPVSKAEPAADADSVMIEPQPDLSEQLIPDEPADDAARPAVPAKSSARPLLIILGLVGILLFFAIFLAAVYFLFFSGPAGVSDF